MYLQLISGDIILYVCVQVSARIHGGRTQFCL
jgi:hypothetical protein